MNYRALPRSRMGGMNRSCALLSPEQARRADQLAAQAGIDSYTLMENAGMWSARLIARHFSPTRVGGCVHILCGGGNNGGDGFVAARHLLRRGFAVRVFCLADPAALKGDAARAARNWPGKIRPVPEALAERAPGLFVDALFGTGLARPLSGIGAELAEHMNGSSAPVAALDIPSGIEAGTGAASGPAVRAARTITFFRPKPGHFLMPGREFCGEVDCADIGIPERTLDEIGPDIFLNGPALWAQDLPRLEADIHKYRRGSALIVSGPPARSGAARLAARAALRSGAGLATLAAPEESLAAHAAQVNAIMLAPLAGGRGLSRLLVELRVSGFLLGPGGGIGEEMRRLVRAALALKSLSAVLDADALTSFAGAKAKTLFSLISGRKNAGLPKPGSVVLTPHEGEFARLFPQIKGGKIERARQAAEMSGAVVVLKGPDSVIADPGGLAAINATAPPELASAGSGDVLAGIICGFLAQGMAGFEAACAGVFLHGRAGRCAAPGLIAEDLIELIPHVLRESRAGSDML